MARPPKRGQMPLSSKDCRPRLACQARYVRKRVLLTCSQHRFPATRIPVSSAYCKGAALTQLTICATVGVSCSAANCSPTLDSRTGRRAVRRPAPGALTGIHAGRRPGAYVRSILHWSLYSHWKAAQRSPPTAAGSVRSTRDDDASPHQGWLPASRCDQHVLAALPSSSRSPVGGSEAFVLDRHSTAVCYSCGYLSPVTLLAHGSARAPGLISPALLPTAPVAPHSLLLVVLSAPLLSWLYFSSLGNPA
jgi:hypothetical protein